MSIKRYLAFLLAVFYCDAAIADPFGTGMFTTFGGGVVGTLAIDGSNLTYTASCPCTSTITTADTNDIIAVVIFISSTASSVPTVSGVSDTAGLTWALRRQTGSYNNGGHYGDLEIWWAKSTGTLSSDTITVTSGQTIEEALIAPVGINGANLSTPWDPSAGANTTGSAVTTLSRNITTAKAKTIILAGLSDGLASWGTLTGLTGFTTLQTTGSVYTVDYKIVSTTQSAVAETYSWTNAKSAGYVLDAIQASGQ